MLVRSLEGPRFLLLEGDDLGPLRQAITDSGLAATEAVLPLAYLLNQASVDEQYQRLHQSQTDILAMLDQANDWEAQAISSLIGHLRDVSIACMLLSHLECSQDDLLV